jgi:AcrR family transcriptional regulator
LELASFILPLDDTKAWRLKRRQRILEAAAALFARETYQAVQMDDVAHLAGTGKATVYRYFPSKQELYLEAFDQALGVLEDAVTTAAAAGGPPPQRLEAMLRGLVATFADQLPSLQVLGGDDSHLAERGRQVFRRRAARIADRLRAVIEEGMAEGRFRAVDTEVIARMMISMCRGAAIAAATTTRERAVDAVLDMALRGGLAVGTGSPQPAAQFAQSKRWRTAS